LRGSCQGLSPRGGKISRHSQALTDRLIPDLDLDAVGKWEIVNTEGKAKAWAIESPRKIGAKPSAS